MDIVAMGMERLQALPNLIIEIAPGVALAILIFFIGRAIVRRLSRATETASSKVPNVDTTLSRFFGSTVLFIGTAAVIVAALSAMNVNLAFLATIVASMFVALGFALQDALSDVASGIMLMVFRPFKVGDEVELNGEKGVVTSLGLFSTGMTTRDNIEITVGNSAAFGNTIKNFYHYGERRLDMDFGVSYDADIGTAITALLSVCEGDARIRSTPEPWAKVTGLGDSAVNIQLRIWCDADEHRNLQMDIPERVKHALDKANIEIPYEHNMIIPMKAVQNAV
ncbi:MAG: mechanosensitive ion channel family protein [Hyphomonadaceae bacterium]